MLGVVSVSIQHIPLEISSYNVHSMLRIICTYQDQSLYQINMSRLVSDHNYFVR